jgi:DNA-binding MarR family transcriptional regulator
MIENDDESLKLSNQLCFAIYSTAHAFTRIYKPILDPFGLTYPQYLTLLVLWERDGLTVKEIGQRLHLDSGTLTPVLKRLEASGYVQRSRDMADERQVRVTLTQRGREIRKQAAAGRREVVCASGWTEEQIRALKGELDQLRTALRGDAQNAEDDMSREGTPTLTTPLESQPRRGKRARQV